MPDSGNKQVSVDSLGSAALQKIAGASAVDTTRAARVALAESLGDDVLHHQAG